MRTEIQKDRRSSEPKGARSKQLRLQIDMSEAQLETLDTMVRQAESVKSRRELINNALTLFRWAISQRQLGRILCAANLKDKEKPEIFQVLLPALDEIATLESTNAT